MNRSETVTRRGLRAVGSILLALLLFAAFAAAGQDITVTAADPPETEQGTLGLVVKIAGANFGKDAKVDFLVSGTTNPGGIVVRSVKYRNPKSLEATIDVAPDAQTQDRFDIQVMSGGRTGKGTELFKVLVKVTGGDLTPPGPITIPDLRIAEGTIGYNTATIEWTAPADDGYDATSGPAAQYDLRVRLGACGPYTADVWGDQPFTGRNDPCHVYKHGPYAGTPGTTESAPVLYLNPDTDYIAAVRTADDSTQGPNWSPLPDPSQQLHFRTGSLPATPWAAEIADASPVLGVDRTDEPHLAFDAAGAPSLLYFQLNAAKLATRSPQTGWLASTIGAEIDTGNYQYDLAFDPLGWAATITNVVRPAGAPNSTRNQLRFYRRTGATADPWEGEVVATGDISLFGHGFDPIQSVPTIAFQQNVKSNTPVVRVAQKHGATWTIQDVASGASGRGRLTFNAFGDPAVTLVKIVNGAPALGFALREGSRWTLQVPEPPPGPPWNALGDTAVAFDPIAADFAVAGLYRDTVNTSGFFDPHLVRFCERRSGSWSCETLAQGSFLCSHIDLAVAPDGTRYLAYYETATLYVFIRGPGETTWSRHLARWDAMQASSLDLHIDPSGQPAIAYTGSQDASGAGGRGISVKLTRSTTPLP